MSSEDISFIDKWIFIVHNKIHFRISLETSKFDYFLVLTDWHLG